MEFETKAAIVFLCAAPIIITVVILASSYEPPCIDGHHIEAMALRHFNILSENPKHEIINYTPVSGWGKAVIVEYITRC